MGSGGFFYDDAGALHFLADGVADEFAAVGIQANDGVVDEGDELIGEPDQDLPGAAFCDCTTFHNWCIY
jgi:hypothetical protein